MTAHELGGAAMADYDAAKDLAGSLDEGYRAIRERVAAGGPGWNPGGDAVKPAGQIIIGDPGPLPNGVFNATIVDPPLHFKTYSARGQGRSASRHYPTMTLEELAALPIGKLAAKNCLLPLWVPPWLPPKVGEELLNAWGFRFSTQVVWVKDKIGLGYRFRNQHEIVLIGIRGRVPAPATKDRISSVICAPRGRHSEKPPHIHEYIERTISPPWLELFARSPRAGWRAWGNQLVGATP